MEASHQNETPTGSRATVRHGRFPGINPIAVLLFVHVVASVVSGWLSENSPAVSSAIFIGIILSQTSLLGMWAGLGTTHWLIRLIGLAIGTSGLALVFGLGISEFDFYIFVLIMLPAVLVASTTWIVRLFKGTLQRVEKGQPNVKEALQFSIRHLMLLTFVVACLTTVGKMLAPHLANVDTLATVLMLGLCYVSVALASIWAILGTGHVLFRSCFVVVIAIVAGLFAGYAVDQGGQIAFWFATTVLQAGLLIASLSVIRRNRYRFVAKDVASR